MFWDYFGLFEYEADHVTNRVLVGIKHCTFIEEENNESATSYFHFISSTTITGSAVYEIQDSQQIGRIQLHRNLSDESSPQNILPSLQKDEIFAETLNENINNVLAIWEE